MTPRDIIAKAWAITKKETSLRVWGFITALLQTLLSTKLLIYQVWFLVSFLSGDPIGFFTVEAVILHHLPRWLAVSIIITFFVLVFIELIFPNLAYGAIIGLAAKSYKKEPVKGGLVLALYNFFRVFASHEAFGLSSITFTITLISLALRYGQAAAPIAIVLIIILFTVSTILRFTAIFADEAIVINKVGFLEGWKKSRKLLISYIGHIVFLILLTFIITLRIFINAIFVFVIPGIALGVGFLLTMFLPKLIGWGLAALLAFVLLLIASYFFAYLEVFRQTVWTITYMELSEKKELDIIVD